MFDQNPRDWLATGRTGYAIVNWVARGCANTVEVFLHKRFGHRYLGVHSLIPLPIMFFYTAYWAEEGYDVRPMASFMFLYVLALPLAMLGSSIARWRGKVEHSRYNGLPRLFNAETIKKEVRVKEIYEPLLVVLFGFFLTDLYSPPLGLWLVLAGVCLGGINSQIRQRQNEQDWDLQDAMIEQRFRMEEAREMQHRLGM